MIEDERQVSEVRLASAFILLKHEPSETEIRPIVQICEFETYIYFFFCFLILAC